MIVARISQHGNSHGVTIPRPVLRELGWVPGDVLKLEWTGGAAGFLQLQQVAPNPRLVMADERRRGKSRRSG